MNEVNQTPHPRRALGLKMLLGTTLIVLVLTGASFTLSYSFLSSETTTFTFETQTSHSQLLGQRFAGIIENATQTLKFLPALDDRANAVLENQKNIRSLQAFRVDAGTGASSGLYLWGEAAAVDGPGKDVLEEIKKTGIAYQAERNRENQAEVHLYALLGNSPDGTVLTVARAKLDLSTLKKQSGGARTQLLNRAGQILLDSRNPDLEATMTPDSNPLFKIASRSPVSLGTLEYTAPDTGDRYLGTYVIPGYNVVILNSVRYLDAMKGAFMLLEKLILTGLALLGASLIAVVLFARRLTRPLEELTAATHVISSGNFDLALKETSSDEIGILSQSMNVMSKKIQELLLESIEKVKIEQEVAIASTLQQNLIPPASIVTPRYRMESFYQSARQCGGDWWGYVESGDSITLLISDATGHGLPPAMLTAATHGCFAAIQKILSDFPTLSMPPSELLRIANQVIVDSADSELNMTMLIATIDLKQGTLTYSNAGHNMPWLVRGGTGGGIELMKSRGFRLGEATGFAPSPDVTLPFGPEDVLFLYTDGLIENPAKDGSKLEKDRIRSMLSPRPRGGIAEASSGIIKTLEEMYGGVMPEDDVTYVLFQKSSGDGARA